AYGRYARETGLDQRSDVKQTISDNEKIYWSQEFRQSSYAANFLFEKKHIDSLTTVWKDSLFKSMAVDSAKGANRDGARLALLAPGFLRQTYLLDIDKYRHDSTFEPYDSVRTRVYGDLRSSLDEKGRDRIDSVLKARYEFKLLSAAPQVAADLPFAAAFDSARANHDRRTLDQAEKLYHQVERDTKAPDTVRAQALFQLGQLYGEQQNYPRSLNAYRSVLLHFGKSNEAYKAQFMIAFTYSEYLKNEKAALSEYGKMLTNYPKSDLTDDADWMIRNIKSGGALMPKFDDSAFVADSVARADSLKKASAKSDTAKKVAPVAGAKTEAAKAPVAAKPTAATKDSVKSKVAAKPVAATKDSTTAKAKVVAPAKDTAKAKVVKPTAAKADTAKAGAKK
ncbi:MAG: tetratricopeptide repeat protein, partial [Fibrobacterota bacterium]